MKKSIFASALALGVILPLIVSAAWWPFSMIGNRGNNEASIKRSKAGDVKSSDAPSNKLKSGAEISI